MTRATVTATMVDGFAALAIENQQLRAVIIPELGGRVWSLEDRVRARQWIWHRDAVPLTQSRPGANYDEVWAGGWEELFPNDAAGPFEGRSLPDHGEWWTMVWHAIDMSDERSARVRMTATSTIIKAECTKEITLCHDAAALTVSYQIRSLESEPFHFLFKQHLPVRITPSCRLTMAGGRVELVDPSFGTVLGGAGPFEWPGTSSGDLRIIPPATSGEREFVYVKDVPQPWCGVDDLAAQASIRMEFDAIAMPYVWLFLSYGGWRDTYTAVLEPCTNMPKELGDAVRRGQSARLAPGQSFTTSATVRLSGLQPPL